MLHKPLYIASYHRSKFGKPRTMTVPEVVANAVLGACSLPERPLPATAAARASR